MAISIPSLISSELLLVKTMFPTLLNILDDIPEPPVSVIYTCSVADSPEVTVRLLVLNPVSVGPSISGAAVLIFTYSTGT